jgi:spermidine/putrescine transport system substrate-binding protein
MSVLSRRRFVGLAGQAATVAALPLGCRGGERKLSLYNWGDYVAPEVLREFETRTGAKVVEDSFLAEAEVMGKLRAATPYDVAITIDYLVSSMQREQLISELSPLPAGVEHLDPAFPPWQARPDRGGGIYGIPYLWGTTGIGYDSEKVEAPRSWNALFDPTYTGRISVLDSKGDVMDQALLASGLSINTNDKARLREEIGPMLLDQKDILRAYDGDPARALVAGETWLAQIDSGDLLRAQRSKPSLRYVIPDEGATIWTDYLVIPAHASDRELARRFLELLLEPEIAAMNANFLRFGTPSRTALERGLVDDAADPQVYPPPEVRARLHASENWAGSTAELVDELWVELRASS